MPRKVSRWVATVLRAAAAALELGPGTGYQPTSGPAHPTPPQAGSATNRPGAGAPPLGPAPTPTASPNGSGTGHYGPPAPPAVQREWCGCEMKPAILISGLHSVMLASVRGKLHARRVCLATNKIQDTPLERIPPSQSWPRA
jgi:hypothetical protein